MTTLAFVDCETTGLHPVRHEIWEIGLILRKADSRAEYVWQLPVDLSRADVIALNIGRFHERRGQPGTTSYFPGPDAFDQSGEFSVPGVPIPPKVIHPSNLPWFCGMLSGLLWGAHLVAAVPSFDAERLDRLFRRHRACAGWHYHLIDIEALAAGYVLGRARAIAQFAPSTPQANEIRTKTGIDLPDIGQMRGALDLVDTAKTLPWDSEDLSRAVGVDPDKIDRHTALGDARWAEAMFAKITTNTSKAVEVSGGT